MMIDKKKIISAVVTGCAVIGGCALIATACGTEVPDNVKSPQETISVEDKTPEPEKFEGDIKSFLDDLSIMKETNVYDNLGVTGDKLGDLDIYWDKQQDKYAVICGQSLVYLPIDKDGVVKLNDGIYKYWDESRSSCTYIYVGKEAEKLEENNENSDGLGEVTVSLNGYRCDTIKSWKSEGDMDIIDLESLCSALPLVYCVNGKHITITGLNDKLKVEIDRFSKVTVNGKSVDCAEVENIGTSCIVGTKFLEDVFGMDVNETNGNIDLSGTLVPKVMLLENYTPTGATDKPFDGKKSGISILKVFGHYEQSVDIARGLVSNQVFYRNW